MRPELPIPEIIIDNGWIFKSACRCSGNIKYKFTHPLFDGLLLVLYVKRVKFKITDYGMTKLSTTKLDQLDSVMKLLTEDSVRAAG